jgi:hypothetical protein
MIVYVDDLKIAGPKDNVKEAWRLIGAENARTGEKGIVLDEPTPAGKFLGCNRECSEIWAPPTSKDQSLATKLATEAEYDTDAGARATKDGVRKYDAKTDGVHKYDVEVDGIRTYDTNEDAQVTKDGAYTYDAKTDGARTYDANDDAVYDKDGVRRCDAETRVLIPPWCVKYKHIKYDMSDFLGSCVRLYQDLTNAGNVPL